jgi:hypothetical protein
VRYWSLLGSECARVDERRVDVGSYFTVPVDVVDLVTGMDPRGLCEAQGCQDVEILLGPY